MKAVKADTLDSLADYRLTEVAQPRPAAGELLVKVAACGVGYVDALVALGRYQVKPPLPHVPGQEVAGTVEALGEGVGGPAPGTRVLAAVRGGFAEYAVARADAVCEIPAAMPFVQAAGFRINYVTALHGLRDRAALAGGERLLVFGAAGGVGAAAIQVGKTMGARVIAVASSDAKREFARSLGADAVIDTQAEGWRDRLKAICDGSGPDVVFDPVCGPLFEPAFRSLSWRGRHLVIGFVGGPIPALRSNLTLMKGAALVGVDVRQFLLYEPVLARQHLETLLGWVGRGLFAPPVGREFGFEEFGPALEYGFGGQGLGKTVLRIAG